VAKRKDGVLMDFKKCNGKTCIVINKKSCARFDPSSPNDLKDAAICSHFVISKSKIRRR